MAWTTRDPNAEGVSGMNGWSLPITRGFAMTVLVALLLLIVLRQVFGAIKLEVGTK